jgi:hypothetical protein
VRRLVCLFVAVLLVVLLAPAPAFACSVTYQGGSADAGCGGAAPVIGAVVLGAAAISSVMILSMLSFIRGRMSESEFASVLAAVANLTTKSDREPQPCRS